MNWMHSVQKVPRIRERTYGLSGSCGRPTIEGRGGGGMLYMGSSLSSALFTQETLVPLAKQTVKKDAFQLFAEKVRDHKEFESRWAVLQETRVEYFRGKDFVAFLKNNPGLKDILELRRDPEIEVIANVLLKKNLIVRCDRVVKTVRPGKKKLSTWPAHLEIFPDQVFSEDDAFFAWTFVKQQPLWQTFLSLFWPVLAIAVCLFPVYPHWAKLFVFYSCAGILILMLSVLLLRAAVFCTIWVLLGKHVWFFPNVLAEEATVGELFCFWPKKDERERPKWTSRLFFAMVAVLAILLLRHSTPDEAARARYHKRVSNIIDDVLEWSPKQALAGMMEKQESAANTTEPNNNFTESRAAPDDDDEEITEKQVDDDDDEEITEKQVDKDGVDI